MKLISRVNEQVNEAKRACMFMSFEIHGLDMCLEATWYIVAFHLLYTTSPQGTYLAHESQMT